MFRISFDENDLGQFEPKVREALMRLYRQQVQINADPDAPLPARGLRVLETVTEEDRRKSSGIQYRADGTVQAPDLFNDPTRRNR